MKKIIIMGGGLSGICAALLLAKRKFRVELFESRNHLGGRVTSFLDRSTGDTIDNGQHILMGCYEYTLKFLDIINSREGIFIPEKIKVTFKNTESRTDILQLDKFPAPLHILKALHTTNMVKKSDLFSIYRLALDIFKINFNFYKPDFSIEELLKKNRIDAQLESMLWKPIIISALNGQPDKVDAELFGKTVYSMFFKKYSFSKFLLPKMSLFELFIKNAINYLRENNVTINLNNGIKAISFSGGEISNLITSRNEIASADYYISALPFFEVRKFENLIQIAHLDYLKKMQSSPIISIYLWMKEELFKEEFVFLQNVESQVIFNRKKIMNSRSFSYCVVISSANHLINCSKEYILSVVKQDLEKVFKKTFSIFNYKIIKERNATLLITPCLKRPAISTGINNFFLVGDWINTGLPATIESAIKSSFKLNDLL